MKGSHQVAVAKKLSLVRCREVLGVDKQELSEEQLRRIRDDLYRIAACITDVVRRLSPEERERFEERAAISEYEGNRPRQTAELDALAEVIAVRQNQESSCGPSSTAGYRRKTKSTT